MLSIFKKSLSHCLRGRFGLILAPLLFSASPPATGAFLLKLGGLSAKKAVLMEEEARVMGESLLDAIKTEDIDLYKEIMRVLLESGNIETFLQVLLVKDKAGNNIFHLMAGVQTPYKQQFFSNEMQVLHDLFTGRLKSGQSLGGRKIDIPPLNDGDSPLIQAISNQNRKDLPDQEADLIPKEIIEIQEQALRLKQGPVIEFVQLIYARDSNGQTFTQNLFSPSFNNTSKKQALLEKWKDTALILSQNINKLLFEAKNKKHLKPLDIALHADNPSAWQVFQENSAFSGIKFGIDLAYLAAGVGVWGWGSNFEFGIDGNPVMIGLGIAISASTTFIIFSETCFHIFRKARVKKWENQAKTGELVKTGEL